MDDAHQWIVVEEVAGPFQAELLRGLLEAQGIPVMISQEGIGHVYSLTVGTLGRTQVLVPSDKIERARKILDDYHRGDLENLEFGDESAEGDDSASGDR